MKLALVQMRVDGGEKSANLARAEQRVAEAAARGAEVIVLPEAMPLGWTHPSARMEADDIPGGESYERLRTAAIRHKVYLCSGIIEREGPRIFNSAVLIDPYGERLILHRKIHELEITHDLYARGDRLQVAHTPIGTIGVMVCADGFAPGQVISRTLALMGARVILSPCAWAVPADHDNACEPYGALWLDNYGVVARRFGLWIAGISNVGPITAGPWEGRKCIGNSLLIGPEGNPVVTGPYGEKAETILFANLPTP